MTAKFPRLLPHGPLHPLAAGLWQVTGALPSLPYTRNMLVYRLRDGGLLIHSAVIMDDAGLAALEALGPPRLLLVPSGWHRRDAAFYKARYPHLRVLCPAGARTRVQHVVPVDATCEEALPAEGIGWQHAAGTKPWELAYALPLADGVALVVTDLLFNLPRGRGFRGWLLWRMGSSGFFGVTAIGRMAMMTDRPALAGWLEAQAVRRDIRVISVAHGQAVTDNAARHLHEAAAWLR